MPHLKTLDIIPFLVQCWASGRRWTGLETASGFAALADTRYSLVVGSRVGQRHIRWNGIDTALNNAAVEDTRHSTIVG